MWLTLSAFGPAGAATVQRAAALYAVVSAEIAKKKKKKIDDYAARHWPGFAGMRPTGLSERDDGG
jgi:hypothetical protein